MTSLTLQRIETQRLILRRPVLADAESIFTRYASDPEVTRYVSWPRHVSLADTLAFLESRDAAGSASPAGAYLIFSRADGTLLGSTGLAVETADCACTGYVLARDAWGRGYATEAVAAMSALAASLSVRRLYALCHTAHRASAHVLEKSGFTREATLPRHTHFPNLRGGELCDVYSYSKPGLREVHQ
jgi:RimJ/RimL family protein N-acetyltransferase